MSGRRVRGAKAKAASGSVSVAPVALGGALELLQKKIQGELGQGGKSSADVRKSKGDTENLFTVGDQAHMLMSKGSFAFVSNGDFAGDDKRTDQGRDDCLSSSSRQH